MLLRASAKTVAVMAFDGSLFLHLADQFAHMHGYRPSPSEARSWECSIPVLAAALTDAGLGDVEMMLEYALLLIASVPMSSSPVCIPPPENRPMS